MATRFRVGNGFDFHPLEAGRRLVLGGVEVQHERGLRGHSDADVAAHALANAILGAIGEGDSAGISRHRSALQNADCIALLAAGLDSRARPRMAPWQRRPHDFAQAPKLKPYLDRCASGWRPRSMRIDRAQREGFEPRRPGRAGPRRRMAAAAIVMLEAD